MASLSVRKAVYWHEKELQILMDFLYDQQVGHIVMPSTNLPSLKIYRKASRHLTEAGFCRTSSQVHSKFKREKAWFFSILGDWEGVPPIQKQNTRFRRMLRLWRQGGRPHWEDSKPNRVHDIRRRPSERARIIDDTASSTSDEPEPAAEEEEDLENQDEINQAAGEEEMVEGDIAAEDMPVVISSALETGNDEDACATTPPREEASGSQKSFEDDGVWAKIEAIMRKHTQLEHRLNAFELSLAKLGRMFQMVFPQSEDTNPEERHGEQVIEIVEEIVDLEETEKGIEKVAKSDENDLSTDKDKV